MKERETMRKKAEKGMWWSEFFLVVLMVEREGGNGLIRLEDRGGERD